VLVAESAWERVAESGEFVGSFAGSRRLKGVKNEVKLFRIRRGTGAPDAA
jgi:adenylate cyclase